MIEGDDFEKMLEGTFKTKASCGNCYTAFTFEEGAKRAIENGIRDKVVMCPKCHSVYEVNVTPHDVTLLADVTRRYNPQKTTRQKATSKEEAPNSTDITNSEITIGFYLLLASFALIGLVWGAFQYDRSKLLPSLLLWIGVVALGVFMMIAGNAKLKDIAAASNSQPSQGRKQPSTQAMHEAKKSIHITLWAADETAAKQLTTDQFYLMGALKSLSNSASINFQKALGRGETLTYKVSRNSRKGGFNVNITLTPKSSVIPFIGEAQNHEQPAPEDSDSVSSELRGLIENLGSSDSTVRDKARLELVKLGEPVINPLIAALNHQNGDVRLQAANALGDLHDTRSVEPLIFAMKAALRSEDFRFQMMAALMLGKIGDKRAIKPLRELAKETPVVEITKLANNILKELQSKQPKSS